MRFKEFKLSFVSAEGPRDSALIGRGRAQPHLCCFALSSGTKSGGIVPHDYKKSSPYPDNLVGYG